MTETTSVWANAVMAGLAFSHALRERVCGRKRYRGETEQIIRQILEECWNGQFLQASAGHFRQFWMRDFGMSVEALIQLGYRERVKKTLEYILPIFAKVGEVTTTIIGGKPFNLPTYGSDSVPFLLRSVRVLGDEKIIKKWGAFLEAWATKYWEWIWDKKAGFVRKDFAFAGAKDIVVRQSSCYDMCMVGMLDRDMRALKLRSPIEVDVSDVLIKKYWVGNYFLDDLSGRKYVSADAQIFPFWTGLIKVKPSTSKKSGRQMLLKVIETVRSKKMDEPFPIKYTEKRYPEIERKPIRYVIPNYQGDTIWTQMGALWIDLVSRVDEKLALKYVGQYKNHIEKYKNYLELFNASGKPYRSLFYVADEGMLWSAIFLNFLYQKD